MTDREPDPLSWLNLPPRHPVLTRDGEPVGYAAAVLGDESNGRFDGIVVGIDERLRADDRLMLEVDGIEDLNVDGIQTNLTAEQVRDLPEYVPDEAWKVSGKGRAGRAADRIGGDRSSGWDRD